MNYLKKENNTSILVVDDERDVLEFLQVCLEPQKWEVITAGTTTQAFEILDSRSVFCVISDIAMPDMDGYEFITEIRKRGIPSEVLLMTGFGYNPNHTLVKLNTSGRFPCLFKPFNRQKLIEAIQTAFINYHHGL